jgi:hypothetical protein
MSALQWWSESKRRFVALADMHDSHLLNARKKLVAGHYVPGNEPQADPLTEDQSSDLLAGIDAELQRRGIEPHGKNAT